MALVRSEIGTWAEKTGDSTLVSSSFTPPDNSVLLVFCAAMNAKAGPLSNAPTMSNSGTALTFTPIGTAYGDASWAIRMDVYRVLVTSHAAMTVTFLENNGSIAGQAMAIIAYTGHDTTTPIAGFVGSGNTNIGDGSETQTLTATPTTEDVTLYCLNEDCDGNPANPTMALGWNKIYDFAADAGYGQLIVARRESSTSTSVTCDDTYTAAGNFYKGSMMSFIVKSAGGPTIVSLTDTGISTDSKPTISSSLVVIDNATIIESITIYGPIISGSTVWGHSTGAIETNKRTFAMNWSGTGLIDGSGDNERLVLGSNEYMDSEIVNTGANQVTIGCNQYISGDTPASVQYRTSSNPDLIPFTAWMAYTGQFSSLGYVQIRVWG